MRWIAKHWREIIIANLAAGYVVLLICAMMTGEITCQPGKVEAYGACMAERYHRD